MLNKMDTVNNEVIFSSFNNADYKGELNKYGKASTE
jgi:hypothetical protein